MVEVKVSITDAKTHLKESKKEVKLAIKNDTSIVNVLRNTCYKKQKEKRGKESNNSNKSNKSNKSSVNAASNS